MLVTGREVAEVTKPLDEEDVASAEEPEEAVGVGELVAMVK